MADFPRAWLRCASFAAVLLVAAPAAGFPPYRSTDADTADPYVLELRLGLVKADREGSDTAVAAPLVRANLGLASRFELISEFEYRPQDDEFGDGAAGFKWIPMFRDTWSLGIETLALLPVRPDDDGLGLESQLVATLWSPLVHLHANAGVFRDDRASQAEDGWRASLLAEFPRKGYRPGIELFAKEVEEGSTDVRAGVGVICDIGSFDLRSAVHVGLTREAPDVSFSLWISTKLTLQQGR